MYSGFKVNTSINKSIVSGLNQTQLQGLQRQVDTYTRKLQQQKRKFFSIQDQHKTVAEQYQKEKEKLNLLKKENSKAQNVILQTKIKNLQANLDKAISAYDDTIAYNNKLKGEIDMLRRQKKNYLEMQKSLEEQIQKLQAESTQKLDLLQKKKKKSQNLRNQIIVIKGKNEQERQAYLKQFNSLEKQYINQKREREALKYQKVTKPQTIDTQPLLKFRLRRIIKANKQKLKMIQQYKKHMIMIQEAFNDIKQKSGIEDLDQITNTFIKSEEQNYSLYNYMDTLTQNIDNLQEQNKELEEKIKRKIQDDQQKKKLLSGTTEQERRRQQLQAYIKQKQESANQLNLLIQKIKPNLESTLKELVKSPFNDDPKKKADYQLGLNINDRNIEQYLSDLQKYINTLMVLKQQAKTKVVNQTKDSVTSYTKPIPSANYEDLIKQKQRQKQKDQGKFLQQSKFREYALQFWQKRKNKNSKDSI